jgi:hypothetical protein
MANMLIDFTHNPEKYNTEVENIKDMIEYLQN